MPPRYALDQNRYRQKAARAQARRSIDAQIQRIEKHALRRQRPPRGVRDFADPPDPDSLPSRGPSLRAASAPATRNVPQASACQTMTPPAAVPRRAFREKSRVRRQLLRDRRRRRPPVDRRAPQGSAPAASPSSRIASCRFPRCDRRPGRKEGSGPGTSTLYAKPELPPAPANARRRPAPCGEQRAARPSVLVVGHRETSGGASRRIASMEPRSRRVSATAGFPSRICGKRRLEQHGKAQVWPPRVQRGQRGSQQHSVAQRPQANNQHATALGQARKERGWFRMVHPIASRDCFRGKRWRWRTFFADLSRRPF